MPAVEQLKNTFGERQATTKVEMDLICSTFYQPHVVMENKTKQKLLDERVLQERQWSIPLVHTLEKDMQNLKRDEKLPKKQHGFVQ